MLHAAIHWSDVTDTRLWPLAVQHAVLLYNQMPNESSGLSPHDIFTKTRWPHSKFQDFHVWGCPVYVLDKKIADRKKLPRWESRSKRQVFVGMSPKHASMVPLILSLDTGAITPQFHVVFDDWFATVTSDPTSLPHLGTPEWEKLFGERTYQYFQDDDNDSTPQPPPDDCAHTPFLSRRQEIEAADQQQSTPQPLPVLAPAETTLLPVAMPPAETPPPASPSPSPLQREHEQREYTPHASPPPALFSPLTPPDSPLHPASLNQREKTPVKVPPSLNKPKSPPPARTTVQSPPLHRSNHTRKPIDRLGFDGTQGYGYLAHFARFLHSTLPPDATHLVLKAKATKDPDTLTYDEAMNSPDKAKWQEAAQVEIKALVNQGTWKEVPTHEATSKILPGTWTFRRKRTPDGEVKKYKGRYCMRGDLQEDKQSTYAPVVTWPSV